MPNTLDQDSQEGFFSLLKGPSGAGKSTGAFSFPDVWVADLDRKMPNIAKKHFPKKPINYDTFDNCFLLANLVSGWVKDHNCPYETLFYDSITSLVSLIFKSIGEAKGETTLQLLQQLQITSGGKKQVEMMGIDYYNAETRYIEWFLEANKVLWSRPGNPKNILFSAHILSVESAPDLKTKMVTRTRSIVTAGKKVAAYIPTQFDEVYLFGTQEVGGLFPGDHKILHKMMTVTNGDDDAKTAFRLAPETDFTEDNLYDKLRQQIDGAAMML